MTSIDVAKGVGILFVVMGHFAHSGSSLQPYAWRLIQSVIYAFHMPFFMMIAGFLYERTVSIQVEVTYAQLVVKKAKRLIIPYFVISAIILSVKWVGQLLGAKLEFPVTSDSIWQTIVNPLAGAATILWFIYVLFIIFLIYPLLKRLLRHEILLSAFYISIYFVSVTDTFCINKILTFLVYFHFGTLVFKYQEQVFSSFSRKIIYLLLFFSFALFESFFTNNTENWFAAKAIGLLTALVGASFAWLSSEYIERFRMSTFFAMLGIYSAPIYLLHTLAMGPFKVFLAKFFPLSDLQFALAAVLSITTGLFLPILITVILLSKSQKSSLFMLGIPPIKYNFKAAWLKL